MKKQMGTFRGVIPTDFPSLGSPWLISGLASLYGRSRIADWLRLANVAISNVPGSRVPVYLAGAKMTDYYPLSIVGHGVALNITVQSHVDQICFGLIACRRAVPDLHALGKHVQRAMETLRVLVSQAAAATPPAEPAPPALAAAANGRARRAPRASSKAKPKAARPTRRRVVAVGAPPPAKSRKPRPASAAR
jgi:hypothetical protein